jgi:cyclopropane fatty-acyl-phospholipid synthase-like methyltransferase
MAAQSLPKTLNGITYTDCHHSMLNAYTDPVKVARWSDNYFSSLDGYQRLVREAKLQSGESVLDVACGTGLVGLLACEELGNDRQQVYFVEYSPLMLAEAKAYVSTLRTAHKSDMY